MKLAILGSHPATKGLAPFADREWDIWACGPANARTLPRVDAWFELHDPALCEKTRPQHYMDFLKTLPEVWMRDRSNHPHAKRYPEAEMRNQFGPFFWSSSISYMLAFAISKSPQEIGIWGVMQLPGTRYEKQKVGTQYFIGEAWKRGITITVPRGARALLKPEETRW